MFYLIVWAHNRNPPVCRRLKVGLDVAVANHSKVSRIIKPYISGAGLLAFYVWRVCGAGNNDKEGHPAIVFFHTITDDMATSQGRGNSNLGCTTRFLGVRCVSHVAQDDDDLSLSNTVTIASHPHPCTCPCRFSSFLTPEMQTKVRYS